MTSLECEFKNPLHASNHGSVGLSANNPWINACVSARGAVRKLLLAYSLRREMISSRSISSFIRFHKSSHNLAGGSKPQHQVTRKHLLKILLIASLAPVVSPLRAAFQAGCLARPHAPMLCQKTVFVLFLGHPLFILKILLIAAFAPTHLTLSGCFSSRLPRASPRADALSKDRIRILSGHPLFILKILFILSKNRIRSRWFRG